MESCISDMIISFAKIWVGFNYTFETADVDLTVVDKEVIDIEKLDPPFFLQLDPTYSGRSEGCLLYTSPSPRDKRQSRMPSSA